MAKDKKQEALISPGHRACAGCGQMIAAKAVAEALGRNVIIANATGCLEVTTTPYPESAWNVPWIHSLFENASAIASGARAALDHKSRHGEKKATDVKVIAQGGDGGTFDIGFGLISGMWERGENILYICYDNEAYANTGIQASGATPLGASTTTTPAGSRQVKKDMIAIALAHGLKYVAQASAAFPLDIANKVKKALETQGPSYIQIMSPCIPGWGIKPNEAMKIARLAVSTGLYPLLEYVDGVLINSSKTSPEAKVEEYLKAQARFKYIFSSPTGKKQLQEIEAVAIHNIKKYNLKSS